MSGLGLGFEVEGLGFGGLAFRLRVPGSGFGVYCLGVQGSRFLVWGWGWGVGVRSHLAPFHSLPFQVPDQPLQGLGFGV